MSVQLFIRSIEFMSQYLGHYVLEWPRMAVLECREQVARLPDPLFE